MAPMKYLAATAAVFGLAFSAAPALAQVGPGDPAAAAHIQPVVPDIAPSAIPGAAAAPLATGPVMQKTASGDPTAALFDAVNRGDYNAVSQAISHGANLYAQNQLGETPIDLSVALNRSSITFLLLSTRNETGGDPNAVPVQAAVLPAPTSHGKHQPLHVLHVSAQAVPPHATIPVMGNNPGTPDPSAGFMGFGPKA